MRVVVIFLGIVTIVLAVVLAGEAEWWIAVPDGLFGAGVAMLALESLREDRRAATAPASVNMPSPASPPPAPLPTMTAPPPTLSAPRPTAPPRSKKHKRH